MIKNRSFFDLTQAEIKSESKLTPKEKSAIDAFIAAARAMPKSLCLELSEYSDGNDGIEVHKRITTGSSQRVARLRKKSLVF